jgi:hypothetical protein
MARASITQTVPAGIQKKVGTGTGWVLKSAIEPFRYYMLSLLAELVPYFAVVGRGRTVSRVLYPLRDGDHLSRTPVARRL